MINNKDSGNNSNTLCNVYIGLFSVVKLIGIVCFCDENHFRINFAFISKKDAYNLIKHATIINKKGTL